MVGMEVRTEAGGPASTTGVLLRGGAGWRGLMEAIGV